MCLTLAPVAPAAEPDPVTLEGLYRVVDAQIGPRAKGVTYRNVSGAFEVLAVIRDPERARQLLRRRCNDDLFDRYMKAETQRTARTARPAPGAPGRTPLRRPAPVRVVRTAPGRLSRPAEAGLTRSAGHSPDCPLEQRCSTRPTARHTGGRPSACLPLGKLPGSCSGRRADGEHHRRHRDERLRHHAAAGVSVPARADSSDRRQPGSGSRTHDREPPRARMQSPTQPGPMTNHHKLMNRHLES